MSFFEDMFEGFQRRRHGRHDGYEHHDDDCDDHRRDAYYGPASGPFGGPAVPRAVIPCPRCNAAVPQMAGARFCAFCGGPLVAEPVCQSCGSRITPGAAFCQGCGVKV
jgi:hypothetical protein